MHILMSKGSAGEDVERLRRRSRRRWAAMRHLFPSLTEARHADRRRFRCRDPPLAGRRRPDRRRRRRAALPVAARPASRRTRSTFELDLSVGSVSRLFPATKPANIARYLPYVEAALGVAELTDRPMILGALGTIRAETEGFVPIAEFPSQFNTPPGRRALQRLRRARDLGNTQPGDGARYRGRGFVQLTGKDNYTELRRAHRHAARWPVPTGPTRPRSRPCCSRSSWPTGRPAHARRAWRQGRPTRKRASW